jgi:hypothetical protein
MVGELGQLALELWDKNMTLKTESKPATKAEQLTMSPQMWALNPMVSMVGMAGWAEIMKEGMQFVSERMEKDLQAQRGFLNCKSLEDVLRLQSEYYKDALEQYTEQFQRVAELASQATVSGWSEATAPRARKYDDIPL